MPEHAVDDVCSLFVLQAELSRGPPGIRGTGRDCLWPFQISADECHSVSGQGSSCGNSPWQRRQRTEVDLQRSIRITTFIGRIALKKSCRCRGLYHLPAAA